MIRRRRYRTSTLLDRHRVGVEPVGDAEPLRVTGESGWCGGGQVVDDDLGPAGGKPPIPSSRCRSRARSVSVLMCSTRRRWGVGDEQKVPVSLMRDGCSPRRTPELSAAGGGGPVSDRGQT